MVCRQHFCHGTVEKKSIFAPRQNARFKRGPWHCASKLGLNLTGDGNNVDTDHDESMAVAPSIQSLTANAQCVQLSVWQKGSGRQMDHIAIVHNEPGRVLIAVEIVDFILC